MYKKLIIKSLQEVAESINVMSTPVDDKPITERIKTFEDAVEELGDWHPLVTEYKLIAGAFDITNDLLAYLELRIICAALNEGWEPTFAENECQYYPCFSTLTEEGYKILDEDEKTYYIPLRSSGNVNTYRGFMYVGANGAGAYSLTKFNTRLVFKTKELAEYCGKQFIDIWCDYLFG